MTVSENRSTSGSHSLPSTPTVCQSSSNTTISRHLPKPIPETPKPWRWHCICGNNNPIFKDRCLHCSQKVRTHDETVAEYKVRCDKVRAASEERLKVKNTPLNERIGPTIGVLDGRIKRLKKKGSYRQDFDYKRWSVYQSWRMACEAFEEMPKDDSQGVQTVAARVARKEERKLEFAKLRRVKNVERKERMIHAAGHCERDCRWPGKCSQVLRRILREEKDSGSQASRDDGQEE